MIVSFEDFFIYLRVRIGSHHVIHLLLRLLVELLAIGHLVRGLSWRHVVGHIRLLIVLVVLKFGLCIEKRFLMRVRLDTIRAVTLTSKVAADADKYAGDSRKDAAKDAQHNNEDNASHLTFRLSSADLVYGAAMRALTSSNHAKFSVFHLTHCHSSVGYAATVTISTVVAIAIIVAPVIIVAPSV